MDKGRIIGIETRESLHRSITCSGWHVYIAIDKVQARIHAKYLRGKISSNISRLAVTGLIVLGKSGFGQVTQF